MNDSDKQCRFENRIPGISDSNTDLKLFAKAILKAAGKERMCLEQAKHLILAGEQKAIHIGVPMVLAGVDEGGNLTALHRTELFLQVFPSLRQRPLPLWLSGLLQENPLPPFCPDNLCMVSKIPTQVNFVSLAAAFLYSQERAASEPSAYPAAPLNRIQPLRKQ